jgi:hypothetical protein
MPCSRKPLSVKPVTLPFWSRVKAIVTSAIQSELVGRYWSECVEGNGTAANYSVGTYQCPQPEFLIFDSEPICRSQFLTPMIPGKPGDLFLRQRRLVHSGQNRGYHGDDGALHD